MKLLFCPACDSIFKLTLTLRSCECGKVKGYYETDGEHAIVNGEGYSLAIGNGSFINALSAQQLEDWRSNPEWRKWWNSRPCDNLFLAWVRSHDGKDNSHTTVNKDI